MNPTHWQPLPEPPPSAHSQETTMSDVKMEPCLDPVTLNSTITMARETLRAYDAGVVLPYSEGWLVRFANTVIALIEHPRHTPAPSHTFNDGLEKAARIAERDNTPAYGPHRDDMEFMAACQRRNIATAIRARKKT